MDGAAWRSRPSPAVARLEAHWEGRGLHPGSWGQEAQSAGRVAPGLLEERASLPGDSRPPSVWPGRGEGWRNSEQWRSWAGCGLGTRMRGLPLISCGSRRRAGGGWSAKLLGGRRLAAQTLSRSVVLYSGASSVTWAGHSTLQARAKGPTPPQHHRGPPRGSPTCSAFRTPH